MHLEQDSARVPARETVDKSFVTDEPWREDRPRVMVVACADGRYQLSLDEFLDRHLGIAHYDRLYAAGGPGALASSSLSYFRGEQFRQESAFLVDAHRLEEIVLIFHGPSANGGPIDATCADYRRKMPGAGTREIYKQQEADLQEAVAAVLKVSREIAILAYRAEVLPDRRVQYVPLEIKTSRW